MEKFVTSLERVSFIVFDQLQKRSIALHLCVYHNLRGNFTVRLQEVTGTRPRKQATTHLASVHSHRRERKREIYVYIYISIEEMIINRSHFTCIYMYVCTYMEAWRVGAKIITVLKSYTQGH